MAGKFVVKKGSTGKFRFNLVSTNGQVVATSEAYNSRASALNGIRAVKSLAADAVVDDQTTKQATSAGKAAAPKKAPAPTAQPVGGACGYYTDVALFGGPSERRGCGQTIPPGNRESASPSVELPAGGSAAAVTDSDTDGARARYGPAIVFGGRSPKDTDAAPPSGAILVSTKGTSSVSSSASVKNVDIGPFSAASVRSTCRASKAGVRASATVTGGAVVTAVDKNGKPKTTKPVPSKPPANHTVTGKNSVGDTFKVVFNEQMTSSDGRTIVAAVHLYLLGPTAVGDVVVAVSHAGV